ncbi:tryptophan--tRNA ligase [Halobellus limi]|uniref:Tryptophan--tRNA ligase n=1 Tax=Halobellus limi TaxID=699433 RepID=A0A1H5X7B8_9EURY|nr:tryptophan--tRNA ligase [Halobellus limi]QCC46231.1 tryptophan--tRNA ligase [Halobellus limi]SEG07523.1 tryptophanyl-tRNA synthetase [Halobellus limi]
MTRDHDARETEDGDATDAARADAATAPETVRARTDGGAESDSAAGADDVALDPWGSSTVSDYRKLFEEFGIGEFDDVLPEVPNPHYLMRRGVIFGHRDYSPVAEALRNDDPAAVLSGFMPTGDPHIGHKLVFDEIIWHQEQGADAYGLIADLEAHSARGMTWEEIDEHARDYLLSLLALGFDPEEGELYRQSDNRELQDLAFELGSKANFSEFQGIYGFDGETNVSHMQSVVTQMADILYPQLEEPKPTVIPVGPDQDPHVRFARDLAARMRFFGVTEAYASFELDDAERALVAAVYEEREAYAEEPERPRCEEAGAWLAERADPDDEAGGDDALDALGVVVDDAVRDSAIEKLENAGMEPLRPRVRFLDLNATDDAFEALVETIDGEKRRYDAHVDAFDLDASEAEELAREVELDHGGYGFVPPSSIYHRFMTGLTGGKMSSSIPASHISLLDDPEEGYDKVKAATTGGRDTAEEQRELGGEADECPVYELYAYLLAGDDDEFAKEVYDECVGGERLCGGCKEQAAELMREFLEEHQEKRAEVEDLLDDLDITLESPRRGVAPGDD